MKASRKAYRTGTHRTRSPEDTWNDFSRFMRPAGITRLANVTGLDVIGVPVYTAIRPNSRSLAVSQGKGTSAVAAKVSALMEAIECWHAETFDFAQRTSTVEALRAAGEATIDIEQIDEQQPNPPWADAIHRWVRGYDLLGQRELWVPVDLVRLDFRYPKGAEPAYPQNTNGLASGNHLTEAIVHSLCELIERDAVTLWFLDQESDGKERQIDVSTVDDSDSMILLDRIRRAGLHAGIYDVTSDIGVPSCACILFDSEADLSRMGYFWGFGTHLDRGVALSRAVSEAIQCRLTEITGTRDDIGPEVYQKNRDEEQLRNLRSLVLDEPGSRVFSSIPSSASESLEDDLAQICVALRRVGVTEATVVDLSKPAVGIPVVRVLVPALEGPPFEHVSGRRAQHVLAGRPPSPVGKQP